MATKNEKNLGIVIGCAIGLIKGSAYFKKVNVPMQEQWIYLIGGDSQVAHWDICQLLF